METDMQRSSAFNRLFGAISRARQELSNPEEIMSATRRLFRRRPAIQGSIGRRANPLWQARLFLLPGPNFDVLPSTTDLQHLVKNGLGQPAHNESTVGGESLKIDLTWTLSDLNNFICQSYPQISLNLTGFELARVGKRRKLQKIQAGSVRELKKCVGKSRLYILPRVEIMQNPPSTEITSVTAATVSTSETLQVSENVMPHQEGIPDYLFPCYISNSTAMPGQSNAALISQTLQESRILHSEQDDEYHRSLLADQEKEMRKRALENIEERRRMAIRERCLRLADREEPNNGISLKFKFPDGSVKMGKFNESEPIQVLFDFIGQAEEASQIFKVQEATTCTAIVSTSSGMISEQGIRTNSTFYVLWMSSMDVEEWISSHMENEQPQTTGAASELLLNPHGLLPSSPISDLSQIPSVANS